MTTVVIQAELTRFLVEMIDAATSRGAVRGPELLSWGVARRDLESALEAAAKQDAKQQDAKQAPIESKTA